MLGIDVYSILAVLLWASQFPLYQLNYKKYISLPGTSILCNVMAVGAIQSNETSTLVLINDNYIKNKYFMEAKTASCPSFCLYGQLQYLYLNDFNQRDYYFIFGIFLNFLPLTWEGASDLCEEVFHGHLPWFESKYSLLQFLSVLKLSKYIPVMEAIYIGLRLNASKVSDNHYAKMSDLQVIWK